MTTVKLIISIDIDTNKKLEDVKTAIKRGIYRGLDTSPYYIAQPSNVQINYIIEK